MEELIKIFLSGDGYGDGNGNGDGSGNGDGYGNGYGDGSGYGSGYGNGNGDGSGNGYGDGDGNGSGYGIRLTKYKGQTVYYIDGIPCFFTNIKKNQPFAKVCVIHTSDFSATSQFVFKFNNCFAHGTTLKEAKRDAENKYYSQLDVAERIAAFKEVFKWAVEYECSLFYEWHSTLTGSCQAGKDLFIKQHGIDLSGKMTVAGFIALTKNSYGGDVIRQLESEVNSLS